MKKAVEAGLAAIGMATGFWAVKAGKIPFLLPSYIAERVIDGDTFVTREGQYVRLSGVNAPELQYCLGPEAESKLASLITGKKLYLKVLFTDPYKRLVAWVYTPQGWVNEEMIGSGLGVYERKSTQKEENTLEKAGKEARSAQKGVFSPTCTQMTNPDKKACNVKANILEGKKYYRYPGCGQYNNTIVQLYLRDRWFCTAAEAEKADFLRGSDCK